MGEPLLHYPLRAMRAVLSDVAIITKPQMVLTRLDGAMVWVEPEGRRIRCSAYPRRSLWRAARPVLVCPVDMPFISSALLSSLANAGGEGQPAVIASCHGDARPLVGCYLPTAAPLLAQAAHDQAPVEEIVRTLQPQLFEVEDEVELFDVNTPDDLLLAAGMLDRRRSGVPELYPKVKS